MFLFALAACPNRVVVVNGQEMSPAQAEDQGRAELETVRREVKSLPAAEGGERLAALAGRYRGTSFAPEALEKAHLLRDARNPVKILGRGDVKIALKVKVHRISDSAKSKIEAAGGSVEVIEPEPAA